MENMRVEVSNGRQMEFNTVWLEEILLELGDIFEIRIVWDRDTAVFASVFAVAGGLLGGYAGGRIGAAVGAGIGGVTGVGVSTVVSLREIWQTVKVKLQELLYIVYNFLRRLEPVDYIDAIRMLKACAHSRKELVFAIIEFIAEKLSREVLSRLSTPAIQ